MGSAADTISKLLHTRAWLAAASNQLSTVEELLQSLGAHVPNTSTPDARSSSPLGPLNLRTGRDSISNPSTLSHRVQPRGAVAELAGPVRSESWQGLVRLGLVTLAASSDVIEGRSAPETLRQELQRLTVAQNDFQEILVQAACSLLLQQVAARHGRTLSQGLPPPHRSLQSCLRFVDCEDQDVDPRP